ncbi:toxin glutamine deamidase domain-containing protein [Amycolatopsis roodepoortensis]|uniref:Tox-PL domain-containing protein n=1 Tax=Amycolatopsis roodepoortensis TaxID=700274 RepID=A0ABR9LHY2_9PSEU|nr:toxin glutamine deamidase domain-containing protein [Amycolatopsis roodepoortensis]MBE1579701.1 hypothetical protein [Amycolatopsis roodepoortensis]
MTKGVDLSRAILYSVSGGVVVAAFGLLGTAQAQAEPRDTAGTPSAPAKKASSANNGGSANAAEHRQQKDDRKKASKRVSGSHSGSANAAERRQEKEDKKKASRRVAGSHSGSANSAERRQQKLDEKKSGKSNSGSSANAAERRQEKEDRKKASRRVAGSHSGSANSAERRQQKLDEKKSGKSNSGSSANAAERRQQQEDKRRAESRQRDYTESQRGGSPGTGLKRQLEAAREKGQTAEVGRLEKQKSQQDARRKAEEDNKLREYQQHVPAWKAYGEAQRGGSPGTGLKRQLEAAREKADRLTVSPGSAVTGGDALVRRGRQAAAAQAEVRRLEQQQTRQAQRRQAEEDKKLREYQQHVPAWSAYGESQRGGAPGTADKRRKLAEEARIAQGQLDYIDATRGKEVGARRAQVVERLPDGNLRVTDAKSLQSAVVAPKDFLHPPKSVEADFATAPDKEIVTQRKNIEVDDWQKLPGGKHPGISVGSTKDGKLVAVSPGALRADVAAKLRDGWEVEKGTSTADGRKVTIFHPKAQFQTNYEDLERQWQRVAPNGQVDGAQVGRALAGTAALAVDGTVNMGLGNVYGTGKDCIGAGKNCGDFVVESALTAANVVPVGRVGRLGRAAEEIGGAAAQVPKGLSKGETVKPLGSRSVTPSNQVRAVPATQIPRTARTASPPARSTQSGPGSPGARMPGSHPISANQSKSGARKALPRRWQDFNIPGGGVSEPAIHHASVEAGIARQLLRRQYPGVQRVNARNYWTGSRYHKQNCTRCVVAVERALTYRGLPVIAGKTSGPVPMKKVAERLGGQWKPTTGYDDVIRQMRSAGEGARGVVYISRPNGTAHVFNVVNDRNGIVFLDGQTGRLATLEPNVTNVSLLRYK